MLILLGDVCGYGIPCSSGLSNEWWEVDTEKMSDSGFYLKTGDPIIDKCLFSWRASKRTIDDVRDNMMRCANCDTYVPIGQRCPGGCFKSDLGPIFESVSSKFAKIFVRSLDTRRCTF